MPDTFNVIRLVLSAVALCGWFAWVLLCARRGSWRRAPNTVFIPILMLMLAMFPLMVMVLLSTQGVTINDLPRSDPFAPFADLAAAALFVCGVVEALLVIRARRGDRAERVRVR